MDELTVTVVPVGPDEATIASRTNALVQEALAQGHLAGNRYRVLAHHLSDPRTGRRAARGARRIRAVLYDYDRNHTVAVESDVDGHEPTEISTSARQPVPSPEEFRDAVEILSKDSDLGRAITERRLRPYRPMPPLVEAAGPDGEMERTVAIGLIPLDDEESHEIVGVNMIREQVLRFASKAPGRSRAAEETCGPPVRPEDQQPTVRGTPGEFLVTVNDGDTELWRFTAVRPSASSGTKGSGVELLDITYRGKTVLRQAHVPILNVRYDDDKCGPYRDWQWEEGWFQADGEEVAPGFRRSPTPARTILDTGEDGGNFPGVALYTAGDETVLVSEMEAGWYRYISEWRFHRDGTIRPRFGFAGVANSCVCNVHHHHVYWRFDFDIATADHNRVREFNDPPLQDQADPWHTLRFEIRRPTSPAQQRKWAVENVLSGEAYTLTPGASDGTSDDFGVGDLWVLQHRDGEIDDGVDVVGGDAETVKAHLDRFLDGRAPIDDTNIVVWYAAHFSHDVHADDAGDGNGHIVGPDLTPSNWAGS